MIDPDNLPGINALLNSACLILLIGGYTAIRLHRVGLHKTCMLTALAVSTVFLTSYLYYHLIYRHGEETKFQDQAPEAALWVEQLYYGILLSHIILAIVTVPLALTTAYLGLTNRLSGHKRLAKWTLPIWLYVSITGVVVYWMLYRL
jgi:putative membrane protein